MTDSRAALAEERLAQAWHMTQRCVHGKGSGEPMQTVGYLDPDREVARDILAEYARLTPPAERGVRLVPADVVQAVADYPWGLHLAGTPNEQEAIALIERLRAALSAEVTE